MTAFRQQAYRLSHISNLSDLGALIEKPKISGDPENDANFLLTLCHQVTNLLDRQIKALEAKFIREGGFTENFFRKRLANR